MNNNNRATTSQFHSKWGFILATVGSAVGLANVWGFPFMMGKNGGGAFLVAYLIFIIIFGYVGLPAEYAIGRRAKTGTLGAYENAWESGGIPVLGKIVGWLPLAGSMCIALGYAVIIAYVLKGWASATTGALMTVDTQVWFDSFALKDYSVVVYHVLVVVGTLFTLVLGASSIEKSNKVMMPLFFLLFIVLAVWVAFLPGALEGYKFMFQPRWEELAQPMVWVWAMGQAFFSLSITGSGMIVYGAYLSSKEDIVGAAKYTALLDTIAAMTAALVIIPASFAYGVDVASGPGLLFVALPRILQDVPFGGLLAFMLFTAVVFAGVSSLQNMFEVVAESLMHKFGFMKRGLTLALLAVICLGVGINMEPIYKWGPWMDWVSIYIIPIGATLGAISWFWIMKKRDLLAEINLGAAKKQGSMWHALGRYVYTPFALILCVVALALKVAF